MIGDKERFLYLLHTNIQKDGVKKISSVLEASDFFTAPASTKYHDSVAGGLCTHSLSVYDYLESECKELFSNESIAVVALLHDVCKIGYYKVNTRNVKNDKGVWEQVPYYDVDDKFPMGHGEKSVIMIMDCMKLTTEEMMAIRWHMGGFEPKENYQSLSKAYAEFPLALYLHMADMKATYLK